MSPSIRSSALLVYPVAFFLVGCAGPLVLEDGLLPWSPSANPPHATLSLPLRLVVAQCAWWGVLLVWVALHRRERRSESNRFAQLSIAIYWLVLAAAVTVVARDWKRPTRNEYSASLPVAAELALRDLRARACDRGSPVAAPLPAQGLTLVRECDCAACRVAAPDGCGFMVRADGRLDVALRRDERHALWLFDDGEAQLAFRDGDHACIEPRAGHLGDALRPASWSLALAGVGLLFPWLWGTPTPGFIARGFPGLARAMFLIAWAAMWAVLTNLVS